MNNLFYEFLKDTNNNGASVAHNLCGFDFNQNYKIARLEKSFTLKKAADAVKANDFIIFLKPANHYNNNVYFVEVNAGVVNLDFSIGANPISSLYRKGDFESYRKNCEYAYIIAQDESKRRRPDQWRNCNGSPIYQKRPFKVDYNERVKSFDGSTVYQAGCSYYVGRNRDYIFDKSGYLLTYKRDALRRNAEKIRRERQKAQADAVNIDAELIYIKNALNDAKGVLLNTINNCNCDYESFNGINKKVDTLRWLCFDYNLLEKRYKNKEFSSAEKVNDAVIVLTQKINNFCNMEG